MEDARCNLGRQQVAGDHGREAMYQPVINQGIEMFLNPGRGVFRAEVVECQQRNVPGISATFLRKCRPRLHGIQNAILLTVSGRRRTGQVGCESTNAGR